MGGGGGKNWMFNIVPKSTSGQFPFDPADGYFSIYISVFQVVIYQQLNYQISASMFFSPIWPTSNILPFLFWFIPLCFIIQNTSNVLVNTTL
jgi:hypothetical protein